MAADGVEIGLADEVSPPDAAFKNLLEKTGSRKGKEKDV